MSTSPVKVLVRLRPTASPFSGIKVAGNAIAIEIPKKDIAGPNNSLDSLKFQVDGVLANASQERTFTEAAHDLVENTLQGYNSTLFCYGQTGAGKTFTTSGNSSSYEQRGIVPRAIAHVFQEIDTRVDKIYTVRVSCLEIYNEQMYDLLAEDPSTADHLHCMEDNGTVVIKGLTKKLVKSEEDALACFFLGEQMRSTAVHSLNSNSSRSHVIFTIDLDIRASTDNKERALLSKFNIVDLAGSERIKKSGSDGQGMLEAQFINKSLSFLEQTVNALSRKEAHVPFRQCRLTTVLKDALGGNSRTAMIATIWPDQQFLEETISTLRFAVRVRTLVTTVHQNATSDPAMLLKRYQRQVQELKQELAMRDTLSGRARVNHNDMSEADVRATQILVQQFLDGAKEVDELPLDTIRTIKESFMQCRNVYQALKCRAPGSAAEAGQPAPASPSGHPAAENDSGLVGETEAKRSFNIGRAPAGAQPALAAADVHSEVPAGTPMHAASERGLTSPGQAPMDREAGFDLYKRDIAAGTAASQRVKDLLAQQRSARAVLTSLSESVNASKQAIDQLQAHVNETRNATAVESEPAAGDGEGYQMLLQLKETKLAYRAAFEAFRQQRGEMDALTVEVAAARRALMEGFDAWFAATGANMSSMTADEVMDPQEEYEMLERERIVAEDPTMLSYVAAKKRTKADNRHKDFQGDKAKGLHARKVEETYRINFGISA